jgi:hypothetical protein
MILIDLLPPGLTFQDLVGPVDRASAGPEVARRTGYGAGLRPRPDRLVRTMELTTDRGLLQRYCIAEHEETSASSLMPNHSPLPQQRTTHKRSSHKLMR